MIGKTSIQTVTSPTLAAGAFVLTFGEFEKVTNVFLSFDDPAAASTAFAAAVTISGVLVTITVMKQPLGAPGAWVVAVTADVNLMKFTVIAKGE